MFRSELSRQFHPQNDPQLLLFGYFSQLAVTTIDKRFNPEAGVASHGSPGVSPYRSSRGGRQA